jgi:branched-chain amino acid transport system permease protein
MILAIFALSLDLLVGYTGLVSFGHAAYFGIGAYALGLLAPKYEAASVWLTLPVAIAAAALAALVVGVFVVRAKGIYFIMVTLAFAQMFYFVFHDTKFGRGSDGISMNFKPTSAIGAFTPIDFASATQFYFFVLVALAAVFAFLRVLLRSTFGRALQGIRSNEHRMRSLGYPVYFYKLASFTLAGALAGLAGFLSAMQFGYVNPELLSWHQSGNVLLMLILGGLGSLWGAVAGAFAFVALQELFQSATKHWQLLLGGTIVLLVIFLPGGLSSIAGRFRKTLVGGPDEARK